MDHWNATQVDRPTEEMDQAGETARSPALGHIEDSFQSSETRPVNLSGLRPRA